MGSEGHCKSASTIIHVCILVFDDRPAVNDARHAFSDVVQLNAVPLQEQLCRAAHCRGSRNVQCGAFIAQLPGKYRSLRTAAELVEIQEICNGWVGVVQVYQLRQGAMVKDCWFRNVRPNYVFWYS